MRVAIAIMLAGALGAGAGCKKDDKKKGGDSAGKVEQKPETPPDKAADAAPAAGSEEPSELAGAQEVPTAEDFEEKAAAEVNAGNLEDEVKKIEKELVPE